MREQTISGFLEQLAGRVPAPGGGATAALHAAQAAALLGMVARYSDGPKYAENAQEIGRILTESDALRDRALILAERDAAAFTEVTDAYRLPKDTDTERAARAEAIGRALVGAAGPPAEVVTVSGRLVQLAEELLPIGNRNVITDVAAAAEAARAAATTARVNVEINLGGIKDPDVRADLTTAVVTVDDLAERVERITAAVRAEISS